jgi:general secretion pathway protein G
MRVMDVLVGFTLAVSFALARETKPVRRQTTLVGASLIWLVLSGSLLLWHEFQVYARTTLATQAFTRHQISQTYDALTQFSRDCGSFPSEDQGLTALSVNPGLRQWKGPYISDKWMLEDVWHHPLRYSLREAMPLVWSCGPDGITGTKDDVVVAYEETSETKETSLDATFPRHRWPRSSPGLPRSGPGLQCCRRRGAGDFRALIRRPIERSMPSEADRP